MREKDRGERRTEEREIEERADPAPSRDRERWRVKEEAAMPSTWKVQKLN